MLQCQERDRGIQCPNESAHSSSLCEIHRHAQIARRSAPPHLPPLPPSDIQEPPTFDENNIPGRCTAATRLGNHCQANARRNRPYCIAHDPEFRRQHILNSSKGGVAAALARGEAATALDVEVVDLADRTGVQVLIDAVLRLELTGQLPAGRSRNIARLLGLAVRNFDTLTRQSYLDGIVAMHEPGGYHDRRNAVDLELNDIAFALRNAEEAEATNETTTAVDRRKRLLETENALGRRPKSATNSVLEQLVNLTR